MKPPPPPTRALLAPLEQFLRIESASANVLAAATFAAVLFANSPWSGPYQRFWELEPLAFGPLLPHASLRFWVNDGLMAIFFLVVGAEIRQELHAGALADRRAAALPLIAAMGGILVPAWIYIAIARDTVLVSGWAIPTATDIAFALGALALIGRGCSPQMRALLLALAIADDLGAVLIIACFYAHSIALGALAVALAACVALWVLRHDRPRVAPLRTLAAIVLWLALLHGGIHPSISGAIVGFLVPVGARGTAGTTSAPPGSSASERLQIRLHPWVAYAVMPVFALANAAIDLRAAFPENAMLRTLTGAIVCALVIGKPLGILGSALLAVRLRIGALPAGTSLRELAVVGVLGGIGFTMSIFVAGLAFADARLLASAKLAVLIASLGAALLAVALGRLGMRRLR